MDFESSITKELEAEQLLGRDLNLERARYAALTGDLATVATEVANQAGSFSDFTKLGAIRQQALADAVGLTVDKLSDSLLLREAQGRSAEELRAIGRDDLANIVEQTTASQKLQAVKDKLLSVATDLAVSLTPLVDALVVALDIAKPLFAIFEAIFSLIRPILTGIGSIAKGISQTFVGGLSDFTAGGIQDLTGNLENRITQKTNFLSGLNKEAAEALNETQLYKDYEKEGIGLFFPKSDQMVSGVLGTIDLARDVSKSEEFQKLAPALESAMESVNEGLQNGQMQIQGIREDYKYRNEGQFFGEFARAMDSIGVKLDNVGTKIDTGNKQTSNIILDSSTIATTTAKRAFNIQ